LGYPDWDVLLNIRSAIMVDFYVSAMWWAVKETDFSPEQVSGFFTVAFNFLNGIKGSMFKAFNLCSGSPS